MEDNEGSVSCEVTQPTYSVQLEPQHIFGLRSDVTNNLFFSDEHNIIFPSGNNCVCYNIQQRQTKFIRDAELKQEGAQSIQALAMSPDRRYLAVSEGTLSIYYLSDMGYSKKLSSTNTSFQYGFVCMAFSADSRYLLGQAGAPDWLLSYYDVKCMFVIAGLKTTNYGSVTQVSFNPKDNTQICVSGNKVFNMYKLENNLLTQLTTFSMNIGNIISHAWLSEACLVSGTENGELFMFQDREWHKLPSPFERKSVKRDSSSTDAPSPITVITQYSKGFACVAGLGIVCLYESMGPLSCRKAVEIRIPQDPCSTAAQAQRITTICLSPSEETLAISTAQGQIYHVNLPLLKINKSTQAEFKFLFHSLHSGSITDLSTSYSKPLVATCSNDNSVHIWNYKTNSLALYKKFPTEPKSISLHPNGLSILVAFTDKVCLMNLVADELRVVRDYNIQNCDMCVFNHDGNMFSAATDNVINIVNIRTGTKVALTDHHTKVQVMKWSDDDLCLASCDMDGAVCKWNTVTGALNDPKNTAASTDKAENEQKSHSYTNMIFSRVNESVFAIGSDFKLIELQNEQVLKELSCDGATYTALTMTCSGVIMIGTEAGTIRIIHCTLQDCVHWKEYQAHSGPITKMFITPDDNFLLTASADSSVLVWEITYYDETSRKELKYTEEFLCMQVFHDKMELHIEELTTQKILQKERYEKELNQKDLDYNQELENVKQTFQKQNEALKDTIQVLNTEKEEQRISHEKALNEMSEKHATELMEQENKHTNHMYEAFKKYERVKKDMLYMQQTFEEKLRKHEETHYRTIRDMKLQFDNRLLHEEKLLQQAEVRVEELQEILDSDFKDVALQYERELKMERNINKRLKNQVKLLEDQMAKYWKIEEELHEQCHVITQLEAKFQVTTEALQQKIEALEHELDTDRNKVRTLKVIIQRMKADIDKCTPFINFPAQLRDNFVRLHRTYVQHLHLEIREKQWKRELKNQQPEVSCSIMKQQSKDMEDMMKSELKQKLKDQKMNCSNLQDEIKLMEMQMTQYCNIKEEMEDQMNILKEEMHRLHQKGEEMNREEKDEQCEIPQSFDQKINYQHIVYMHKKSKHQKNDDAMSIKQKVKKRQTPQRSETEVRQKYFSKNLEHKVAQSTIVNSDSMYELKKKLRLKELELCAEKRKVQDSNTLVENMRAAIQRCLDFIQQPQMLKHNVILLNKTYVPEVDVKERLRNLATQNTMKLQPEKQTSMSLKDWKSALMDDRRANIYDCSPWHQPVKKNFPFACGLTIPQPPTSLPPVHSHRPIRTNVIIHHVGQGRISPSSEHLKLPPV